MTIKRQALPKVCSKNATHRRLMLYHHLYVTAHWTDLSKLFFLNPYLFYFYCQNNEFGRSNQKGICLKFRINPQNAKSKHYFQLPEVLRQCHSRQTEILPSVICTIAWNARVTLTPSALTLIPLNRFAPFFCSYVQYLSFHVFIVSVESVESKLSSKISSRRVGRVCK